MTKPSAADQAYAAAQRMREYSGRPMAKPDRADFDHIADRETEEND